MLHYLFSRTVSAIIVILGVSSIVFLLIHLIPGDPVEVMLGESAMAADKAQLRESLGLNLPLLQQWLNYLQQLAHFDLGQSLHSQKSISSILAEKIPVTAYLALTSICVAMLLAFPLGIVAALRKDSLYDRGAMTFAMLGAAIPNFWLGPLLVLLFAFALGWLPVSGMESPGSIVLPAITLGTALAALQSRMIRASMLEILNEDYIRSARARGFSETRVILQHALRNALIPTVTILGAQLGALLTGAVVTEQIFDWPGIGQLIIESIHKRDYPLVQACILIISITYVVVNLITDLLYVYLDPRIRLDGS